MKIKMKKTFYVSNKLCIVTLLQESFDFVVIVDGIEYKRTPNELLAIQVFNDI